MERKRFPQAFPVLGQIDRDHRERTVSARLHSDRGDRRGAPAGRIVRHHRALDRIAQRHDIGCPTLDRDRRLDPAEGLPAAAVTVSLGIVGVELEHEQVELIDMEIGAPERKTIGVPLHDPRQPRRAAADHVEPGRAEVRDVARAEAADAEMGIVGEDRPSGCGA